MELILASSNVDGGIGCWDLLSGIEQLRYRSCASPSNGLLSVSQCFIASSQTCEKLSSSSAPIFFWSWEKPQVQVRSFPAEPIGPLACTLKGFYLIGGGISGAIYLWEVATGKLLIKWNAHYRSVTCLALSGDDSLLISGSEDGSIRVWPLIKLFDAELKESGENVFMHSFSGHALPVTSVIIGFSSIAISSSEDRTCKVWCLSEGRLLRSITFPSIINSLAIDPCEHKFYAGCRDGKIYIAALHIDLDPLSRFGDFILGNLSSDNSMAITGLASSSDGITLVSGSNDGTIRIWNTKIQQMTRLLKHAKNAPISNILIVKRPAKKSPYEKQEKLQMPPPLDRFIDDSKESRAVIIPRHGCDDISRSRNKSKNGSSAALMMRSQIQELQQNASAGAAQMEAERWKQALNRTWVTEQQLKKSFQELLSTFVNEL